MFLSRSDRLVTATYLIKVRVHETYISIVTKETPVQKLKDKLFILWVCPYSCKLAPR